MNLDTALQGITHFFNDIIGAVVPGFVLLAGLVVMYEGLLTKQELALITSNQYLILVILAVSFATGHVLLAIYKDFIEVVFKKFRYKGFEVLSCKFKMRRLINGNKENMQSIEAAKPYLLFKSVFECGMSKNLGTEFQSNIEGWSFHDLRSMAMSLSSEAASLGQRFMFISLLCNGVGTALILLWLNFLACIYLAPHLLRSYSYALPALVQLLMLIFSAVFLIRRGDEFHKRALAVPFCVVNSSIWKQDKNNGTAI